MKKLHFTYSMELLFGNKVSHHRFTLKCIPVTDNRQKISGLNVSVSPNDFLSNNNDSFGNQYIYGCAYAPHDRFSVTVSGNAETGLADREPVSDIAGLGLYRQQTALTRPGEKLKKFFSETADGIALLNFSNIGTGNIPSDLEKASAIMKAVYWAFEYVPGATSVDTTAEQAFEEKKGVCQDYTHVMLSLCRMAGIPCRYTVGMMAGEGRSHAWAEVCCDGKYWIGLDPTNDRIADENYIKISSGRDYNDCVMDLGIFVGFASQKQEISVNVMEII